MRRDVRILLVGDDGVGKSSLITTLIKEHFVTRVQKVVPEITLPPEVTPEGVMTKIVDSSREYLLSFISAVAQLWPGSRHLLRRAQC